MPKFYLARQILLSNVKTLIYRPRDLSQLLTCLDMFARIFSHCEITAFSRPTAFIFIYHQIPVILTLSRNPKHLSYFADFNRSRKHKTARECAAASTALRTPALWRDFPQNAHKNRLDFSTPTIPSD